MSVLFLFSLFFFPVKFNRQNDRVDSRRGAGALATQSIQWGGAGGGGRFLMCNSVHKHWVWSHLQWRMVALSIPGREQPLRSTKDFTVLASSLVRKSCWRRLGLVICGLLWQFGGHFAVLLTDLTATAAMRLPCFRAMALLQEIPAAKLLTDSISINALAAACALEGYVLMTASRPSTKQ